MLQLITSTKEVMFSSMLVCLFLVCLLAGLCKNYSISFHKIHWKGGTWAMEETVRFWW